MGERSPAEIVVAFTAAINARDLRRLEALMADDYTFVDSAGAIERGKAAGVAAWRGFFEQYPDYRNVFDTVVMRGDVVVVTGHSVCTHPALRGPAIWTARVRDGMLTEWRVHEDTSDQRALLGLDG